MFDDAIGALAIFCIFGLPFITWISLRGMQHRERIEMIRHGMAPPAGGANRSWAAAPPPSAPNAKSCNEDPQVILRKGMVLVAVGLALTIGLGFIGTFVDPHRYTFGPWLLGGLIPLFIGLAQVVSAVMSGASLSVPAADPYAGHRGTTTQVPPSSPFEGSYTYRPGAAQELQPPGRPPDRT
jgi:hypothetical protein